MPRYSVFCDNQFVGTVQGSDDKETLAAAYALRSWHPREALKMERLPEGAGPAMHILFDLTNGRALARHESYRALAALHYIQFANVDGLILRCGFNRNYTSLTHDQVASVLHYCGITTQPAEYGDKLKLMRETLENAPWLLLPFAKEHLEHQAFAIDRNDGRPMAYDPNADVPQVLDRWHSEPQANRKRCDSTFWIDYSAGRPTGYSPGDALPPDTSSGTVRSRSSAPTPPSEDNSMATKKPAKKAAKKTVAKKAATKKAATKKAPAKRTTGEAQEERNGVKRPKPGGNTAQVWDACDALYAKKGACPTFKEVDEYVEKKNADIPTATRRSNYAVWRKFHGITGRVSE